MEILKDILSYFINLLVLIYVATGMGVLFFITLLMMCFCWSTTMKDMLHDCYIEVAKDLKEFF